MLVISDLSGGRFKLKFVYGAQEDSRGRRRIVVAVLEPLLFTPSVPPRPFDQRSRIYLGGVATGVAICAEGDQFSRETGRRIALTRALDVVRAIDRASGDQLLNSYDSRPRAPKKARPARVKSLPAGKK